MVVGFTVTVTWILFLKDKTHDLYEMIPGFFLGLAATVLVSRLTYRNNAR